MNRSLRRQCRPALGTLVEVSIHESDLPDYVRAQHALFDVAFSAINQVEREMSFHSPKSALSRLNRGAVGESIELPSWTYEVLDMASQLHRETDGMFDCGVGARLVHAGLLPRDGLSETPTTSSTIADLRFEGGNRVTVLQPTCIDLGGIAKGFAVDKAIEALATAGVKNCVVNAGGDIRTAGAFAEDIFIRHPAAPGLAVLLGQLTDGAVATSAPYYSLKRQGKEASCGLFDPLGASLTAALSYTVLAPTCVMADALTKAVAVAFSRLENKPAPVEPSIPQAFQAPFLAQFRAQGFILQRPN